MVRWYSENKEIMSNYIQYNTFPEHEDTMMLYTGDKTPSSFYIGGIL